MVSGACLAISTDDRIDDRPWELHAMRLRLDPRRCPRSEANVRFAISAATGSVASDGTPARAHFPDCIGQTARKSATLRKSTVPKRSSSQVKPDQKAPGSTDPIIITESEDVLAPSRLKQPQRESTVPQPKPMNGSARGKGKARGVRHDDPIDLEPVDGVSDASDVEMSVPAPRPRSSPNESSAVSAKDPQDQKTIESLRKRIDELLDFQIDQQRALESWKARQEASNGGMSFKCII